MLCCGSWVSADRIEAVRGKQYRIDKRHGPWMIMVATFQEPPPAWRTEGMTPREAADRLVYELRKKGIPAYTFSQEDVKERVRTVDRRGREQLSTYIARQGGICVLAGNYPRADAEIAQKTLKFVKRFRPRFLRPANPESAKAAADEGSSVVKFLSGGVYRKTPGQPGPLSGAFMTINPLLSPEEIRRRQKDPLLLKLNSGREYSLLENPGEYTLVVKSFYGKSTTQVSDAELKEARQNFQVTDSLDDAAEQAWQLTQAMRNRGLEAWIWHGRYKSVVTIGAFASTDDPRIARLAEKYRAKRRSNPSNGEQALIAETFTIPAQLAPGQLPDKKWIFDPQPRLMRVPRAR